MFTRARWKLTLAFAGALAVILALTGTAVYLSVRATLYNRVNDDLKARLEREVPPLAARLVNASRMGQPFHQIPIGPSSAAAGYFYALVGEDRAVVVSSTSVQPQDLAGAEAEQRALTQGSTFVDVESSEGDTLRIYVRAVRGPGGQNLFLEVGRSIEPEQTLLRGLLFVLVAGGGAGLVLALIGGFFIAGRALRPIQAAMDRQNTFVADASHELRTPLALIRASAELLQRHRDDTVQANMESVDDIICETDRLSNLVGRMLSLARADAGQAPLELTDVDMRELTEDVVRQARKLCGPERIPLDVPADGPLTVRGDASRLRELLFILLDNAIKYGDAREPVGVTLHQSDGKLLLRVSDKGQGIPEHALPRVFDRFYRVDKARSREKGGAGLGLAIARWIVEAHGGTIRIDSVEGEGTSVTVELPAA
ncbi:MAG: HAMP domain-containing sensor histidine kinase [Dehalococcoidia bacterium]|nr:HAMP domain-containing sensor histidine kinase [Dehalococcoidia bacterium]